MNPERRSVLAALGLALPWGIPQLTAAGRRVPELRFRSFEDAVREAFADAEPQACRRISVGYSEWLGTGIAGCHNERPFAGFPAGQLRIVRIGGEPGTAIDGVRLFVSTVDVERTDEPSHGGRPFDFTAFSPAPVLGGTGKIPAQSA